MTADPLEMFRLGIEDRRPTPDELLRAAGMTALDVRELVAYSNGGTVGVLVPAIRRAADLGRIDPLWADFAEHYLATLTRSPEEDSP